MYCVICQSGNQAEFAAEMLIHFSGIKYVDKPGVLAFPRITICLDCGFSRFTTPKTELRALGNETRAPLLNSSPGGKRPHARQRDA
jgi:hypothetical protein